LEPGALLGRPSLLEEIFHKAGDNGLDLVKAFMEEVISPIDSHHAFWRGHMLKPFTSKVVGGLFVLCAVDE